jgi:hypothetical protein
MALVPPATMAKDDPCAAIMPAASSRELGHKYSAIFLSPDCNRDTHSQAAANPAFLGAIHLLKTLTTV